MQADSAPFRKSSEGLMQDDDENLPYEQSYQNPRSRPRKSWQDFMMFPMVLVILILSSIIVYQQMSMPACRSAPSPPHRDPRRSQLNPAIDEIHTNQVRFVSTYAAKDTAGMAAVDAAWDAITPTVGTVSLDEQFAMSLGLPAGDPLLADPSKSVYVLEAYHSVHCLKVVRDTLFRLARGEKLIVPFGHATHCLAGILEHVVCTADDTLLFYKEGVSTGDGQARTCRNWGALRDWASNNTACYTVDEYATQHEDLTGTLCARSDGLVIGDI